MSEEGVYAGVLCADLIIGGALSYLLARDGGLRGVTREDGGVGAECGDPLVPQQAVP